MWRVIDSSQPLDSVLLRESQLQRQQKIIGGDEMSLGILKVLATYIKTVEDERNSPASSRTQGAEQEPLEMSSPLEPMQMTSVNASRKRDRPYVMTKNNLAKRRLLDVNTADADVEPQQGSTARSNAVQMSENIPSPLAVNGNQASAGHHQTSTTAVSGTVVGTGQRGSKRKLSTENQKQPPAVPKRAVGVRSVVKLGKNQAVPFWRWDEDSDCESAAETSEPYVPSRWLMSNNRNKGPATRRSARIAAKKERQVNLMVKQFNLKRCEVRLDRCIVAIANEPESHIAADVEEAIIRQAPSPPPRFTDLRAAVSSQDRASTASSPYRTPSPGASMPSEEAIMTPLPSKKSKKRIGGIVAKQDENIEQMENLMECEVRLVRFVNPTEPEPLMTQDAEDDNNCSVPPPPPDSAHDVHQNLVCSTALTTEPMQINPSQDGASSPCRTPSPGPSMPSEEAIMTPLPPSKKSKKRIGGIAAKQDENIEQMKNLMECEVELVSFVNPAEPEPLMTQDAEDDNNCSVPPPPPDSAHDVHQNLVCSTALTTEPMQINPGVGTPCSTPPPGASNVIISVEAMNTPLPPEKRSIGTDTEGLICCRFDEANGENVSSNTKKGLASLRLSVMVVRASPAKPISDSEMLAELMQKQENCKKRLLSVQEARKNFGARIIELEKEMRDIRAKIRSCS